MKHIYCKKRSKLAAVLSFLGGMIFFLPVSHACKAVCVGDVCQMECPSQVPPVPSANSPFSMPVIPGSSAQNPGGTITPIPQPKFSPDRQIPQIPSGITIPPMPSIPPQPRPAFICQIPDGIGWCETRNTNIKSGDKCSCGNFAGVIQ